MTPCLPIQIAVILSYSRL